MFRHLVKPIRSVVRMSHLGFFNYQPQEQLRHVSKPAIRYFSANNPVDKDMQAKFCAENPVHKETDKEKISKLLNLIRYQSHSKPWEIYKYRAMYLLEQWGALPEITPLSMDDTWYRIYTTQSIEWHLYEQSFFEVDLKGAFYKEKTADGFTKKGEELAVALLHISGNSIESVANDLEVTPSLLTKWWQEYIKTEDYRDSESKYEYGNILKELEANAKTHHELVDKLVKKPSQKTEEPALQETSDRVAGPGM